jgi:hypothetical protein
VAITTGKITFVWNTVLITVVSCELTFIRDGIVVTVLAGPIGNVADILNGIAVAVLIGFAFIRDVVMVAVFAGRSCHVADVLDPIAVAVLIGFAFIGDEVAIAVIAGEIRDIRFVSDIVVVAVRGDAYEVDILLAIEGSGVGEVCGGIVGDHVIVVTEFVLLRPTDVAVEHRTDDFACIPGIAAVE